MTKGTDEFFVGYLSPMPRGISARARLAVLWLGAIMVGTAAAVAGFQGDAGHAEWTSEPVTMTGRFEASPYPRLLVADESALPKVVILVGEGKCGAFSPSGYCGLMGGNGADPARARLAAMRLFDGKIVQVKGTRLQREGRMMIELEQGDRAVVVAPDQSGGPPGTESREPGPIHVRGWIVDSKCYLGAMKPGEGKAHRACAARCISGGIPPMLIDWTGGAARFYLLADADGAAANQAVLPFVGDEVEVEGRVEGSGDVMVLRANLSSIRRR